MEIDIGPSKDKFKGVFSKIWEQKREIFVKFVGCLKHVIMNSAEIKLDLFRKIDRLDNRELEKIYNQLISLMDIASADKTSLSPELKEALDEALDASKKGLVNTNEEVRSMTREKYSNLFK